MDGLHLTGDCFNCQQNQDALKELSTLKSICLQYTQDVGLHIVGEYFYEFKDANQKPAGITGTILLAESHLAIHTWPERNAVTLDVYVCNFEEDNSRKARLLFEALLNYFQPEKIIRNDIVRGTHRSCENHLTSQSIINQGIETLTPYTQLQTHMLSCLEEVQSPFQKIQIVQTPEFGKAMRLDDAFMTSEKDEFFYHECLVHPAMMNEDNIKQVLIVGGGDGGACKQLLQYAHIQAITLCEIDEQVIKLSQTHLNEIHQGALQSKKVKHCYEDGFNFLKKIQDNPTSFDLIILDLTDPIAPNGNDLAQTCTQHDFIQMCAQVLPNHGQLIMHLGSPFYHPNRFQATLQILRKHFAWVAPYTVYIPLYGSIWGMAIAGNQACPHPVGLTPTTVKQKLKRHSISNLKYYNGEIHQALFALPNYVQQLVMSHQ